MLLQPENLIQSLLLVLPALIHIHGNRKVAHFPDGPYHLPVTRRSKLYLQNLELTCNLPGLEFYHLVSVNADGICRVRGLLRIQPQHPVPRSTDNLAHKIVQGNVHGSFRGRIAVRKTVNVCEDVVDAERVRELFQVHLFQKRAHAFHRLSEIRRH